MVGNSYDKEIKTLVNTYIYSEATLKNSLSSTYVVTVKLFNIFRKSKPAFTSWMSLGVCFDKKTLFFFEDIKYCSDTIVGMYDTRSVLVHRGIKVCLAKCQHTVTHNCQLRSSIAPHKEHCCQLWEIIMIVVREVVASSRVPECLPFFRVRELM